MTITEASEDSSPRTVSQTTVSELPYLSPLTLTEKVMVENETGTYNTTVADIIGLAGSGGASDVDKAYVDTQDALLQTSIDTNATNIDLIISAPLTEDANVLGTEEILTRGANGVITTINQSMLAGGGDGSGGLDPTTKSYIDSHDAINKGYIDTNTTSITALDTRVAAVEAGGGGTGGVTQQYVDTQDALLQTSIDANATNITTNITDITALDTRVAAVEAGGGGGTSNPTTKIVTKGFNMTIEDFSYDSFLIVPSDLTAINILCIFLSKEDFEAKFGVGAVRKTIKMELDKTIIAIGDATDTTSSIATSSLKSLYGSVRIVTNTANAPTTRAFANAFYDQYVKWAEIYSSAEIAGEYKLNVQLAFEGEYIEVEWRDWDGSGYFTPLVKTPDWFKPPQLGYGSYLPDGKMIDNYEHGILGHIFCRNYEMEPELVRAGIDLGDLLSEEHPLQYRLGMLIPGQILPECVVDATTKGQFVSNRQILYADTTDGVAEHIGESLFTNGLLMYDQVSNTYMVVPTASKTLRGFSYAKCTNTYTLDLGEQSAISSHLHPNTAASAFTGEVESLAKASTQLVASTTGSDVKTVSAFTYIPKGSIVTTVSNKLPSTIRLASENRVEAIYTPIYLFF